MMRTLRPMMANEDEATGVTRNRRKKTNGEFVEEGLRALADRVKLVGEAIKEKAFASAEPSISGAVLASQARQEEALQQQTAVIMELISALQRNKTSVYSLGGKVD
ncbi:hypothetical protein PF008_g2239 [Phytophthora fragariae]|uniref:Uncharacterized protein n=1 Tax=Phytophthora fragariae TaxID=53985 RepID=A0A6G0SJQ4_9STRA|nr:hypothetical protein PF008_g2239 [Phytophthora fragariae]